MAEVRSMMLNPNIPESVRAVASDGTKLRYAMMELSKQFPDVIALGRGDPDLATPPHIVEAAKRAMLDQRTGLTPVAGLPELREAIAHNLRTWNALPVQRENIIVTTGGQEGIFLIMQALIDPGDEVLVPDPRYTSYDDSILRAGGKMVMVPTAPDDAFDLHPAAVEAAITPRTKALLIVTPSNPTGGILTEASAKGIAEVAIRHNLIVISDEIYGRYVFEGYPHVSIGSLPGMAERTITLDGFSKTYAMTGWRVGYVAAPRNIVEAMTRIKTLTTGPVASVSQWAALAAASGPQNAVDEFYHIYAERRALMKSGLQTMGLNIGQPRGGFFIWPNSASTGIHATELAYLVLQEARVLVFPGAGFGEGWDGFLRITVLAPTDQLQESVERMTPVLAKYRS
jgi:aminotransferase